MKKLLSVMLIFAAYFVAVQDANAASNKYGKTTETVKVRELPSSYAQQYNVAPGQVYTRTETTMTTPDIKNVHYDELMQDIRPEFIEFLKYNQNIDKKVTVVRGEKEVAQQKAQATKNEAKGYADDGNYSDASLEQSSFVSPASATVLKLILNDYMKRKTKVIEFPVG